MHLDEPRSQVSFKYAKMFLLVSQHRREDLQLASRIGKLLRSTSHIHVHIHRYLPEKGELCNNNFHQVFDSFY